MIAAEHWQDYELIDTGNGEKLERWGGYYLRRPDPQAIWPPAAPESEWQRANAWYHRTKGGGSWADGSKLPEKWPVNYYHQTGLKLVFYVKLMGFKHTGLFPEQAVNWDWMIDRIGTANRPIRVLNLFAYTGGATVAAAAAGAQEVCHVDAAKGMVKWAKQNLEASGLGERHVRFLTDDVFKFVKREIRRGRKYEGIIMDPPSYGRGPNGEKWTIEENLFELVQLCTELLADDPLFFLVNTYTTGLSPGMLHNVLLRALTEWKGRVSTSEIGLPATYGDLILPCGSSGRWEGDTE